MHTYTHIHGQTICIRCQTFATHRCVRHWGLYTHDQIYLWHDSFVQYVTRLVIWNTQVCSENGIVGACDIRVVTHTSNCDLTHSYMCRDWSYETRWRVWHWGRHTLITSRLMHTHTHKDKHTLTRTHTHTHTHTHTYAHTHSLTHTHTQMQDLTAISRETYYINILKALLLFSVSQLQKIVSRRFSLFFMSPSPW